MILGLLALALFASSKPKAAAPPALPPAPRPPTPQLPPAPPPSPLSDPTTRLLDYTTTDATQSMGVPIVAIGAKAPDITGAIALYVSPTRGLVVEQDYSVGSVQVLAVSNLAAAGVNAAQSWGVMIDSAGKSRVYSRFVTAPVLGRLLGSQAAPQVVGYIALWGMGQTSSGPMFLQAAVMPTEAQAAALAAAATQTQGLWFATF